MSDITTIRCQLRLAAQKEPNVKPFTDLLDKQLKNWSKGGPEERAALRPVMLDNIRRLEAARR